MQKLALVFPALLLVGCEPIAEKLASSLFDRETSTVVLAKQPVLLKPEVLVFSPQEPLKVVGEWTSLCFSLRGSTPLQDSKAMDRVFEEAIDRTKFSVHLTLSNGNRIALRPPLQAWSAQGKIVQQDELSACASTPCRSDLPAGSLVNKIEISVDKPLHVQGIFWESERGVNEKPTASTKPSLAAASSAEKASSCSA